jgi:hypothetical protein
MSKMESILRKAAWSLWLVFGVAFDWIEGRLFHSGGGIGLTLGIILGSIIGYSLNKRDISN